MPDIKVRVGQTNAVKVVASAFGGSLTAENAQNAVNVLGGIASVTQLYNSGITTFLSNLYVAGITTLAASGGITTTGGDFYVGGDLYINDDVVLDEVTARNVNVSGTTTTTNLLVTGIATIGGATVTAGAFENLKVTGISTLSGPVGLGSYVNVVGLSTFNDDVKFVGATSNARWDASTSDLILFNNTRLEFGDNKDFEIWHGGSHTFLKNTGGDLRIRGNKILLKREDGSETYLEANVNNEVKLFFNGVEKVATTLHGIQVSGTTSTTQLGVSGVSTFSGAIDANGQIIAAETSNQIPFVYTNYSNLPVDPDNGLFAQVTERGKAFYSHNSNWYELVNKQINGTIGVGTERYNIGPTNVTTLNLSGISTFVGPSGHVGLSTFGGGIDVVAGVTTFREDVQFKGAAYDILWDQATSKFKFNDSAQAVWGSASGGDLKIFHQSGNSTIRNETGQFRIAGNDIRLQTQNHSEDYLLAVDGGSVSIFHNDVKRLETTASGVNITDTLNVAGLSTFVGNAQFDGNVSIGGTLTYEDVTNIDSVGLITARSGIVIDSNGLVVTAGISTFNADIYVADNIRHLGDTDTYIEFTADRMRFIAGGKALIDATESGTDTVVINEGSNDLNFRVEGQNDEYQIFSDGATDKVGIGSAIPTVKLDVTGSTNVSGTLTAGLIDGGSF